MHSQYPQIYSAHFGQGTLVCHCDVRALSLTMVYYKDLYPFKQKVMYALRNKHISHASPLVDKSHNKHSMLCVL